MAKIRREITETYTTRYGEGQLLPLLVPDLRDGDRVEITVNIPGGGDHSNTELRLDDTTGDHAVNLIVRVVRKTVEETIV